MPKPRPRLVVEVVEFERGAYVDPELPVFIVLEIDGRANATEERRGSRILFREKFQTSLMRANGLFVDECAVKVFQRDGLAGQPVQLGGFRIALANMLARGDRERDVWLPNRDGERVHLRVQVEGEFDPQAAAASAPPGSAQAARLLVGGAGAVALAREAAALGGGWSVLGVVGAGTGVASARSAGSEGALLERTASFQADRYASPGRGGLSRTSSFGSARDAPDSARPLLARPAPPPPAPPRRPAPRPRRRRPCGACASRSPRPAPSSPPPPPTAGPPRPRAPVPPRLPAASPTRLRSASPSPRPPAVRLYPGEGPAGLSVSAGPAWQQGAVGARGARPGHVVPSGLGPGAAPAPLAISAHASPAPRKDLFGARRGDPAPAPVEASWWDDCLGRGGRRRREDEEEESCCLPTYSLARL
eukprot:tig00021432_g21215.t1